MNPKDNFSETTIDVVTQDSETMHDNDTQAQEALADLLAQLHLSELTQAKHTPIDAMPASLQEKLYAQADAFNQTAQQNNAALADAALADNVIALKERRDNPRFNWQPFAMAACLLLALIAWLPDITETTPTSVPLAAQFNDLRAQDAALSLNWTATEDVAALNAQGQVVWHQADQNGFMQFTGLAANDPTEYQYQLWIFDQSRDAEQSPAVDGGVFNINDANAETIVPINAKLAVDKPYLFAVTIERPGGVVVSERERIVVLAKNGV